MSVLILKSSIEESQLGYSPWYADKWDQGTVGAGATNYFGNGDFLKINNDIPGPFGESKIIKGSLVEDNTSFGGEIILAGTTIPAGTETWIRIYHYFPSSFCAAFKQSTGEGGDGFGGTKWLRQEWTYPARLTNELFNFGNSSCDPDGPSMGGSIGEAMASGGSDNNTLPDPKPVIPRDEWVALQWSYIHEITSGTSRLRMWMNDTYLGDVFMQTAAHPGGGQTNASLWHGDYFNGSVHQTSNYYLSNIICTKETPTTLDSGGRPFISSATDAGEF